MYMYVPVCVVEQVTDFGLSIEKDGVGTDSMLDDFCGTPMYMCEYFLCSCWHCSSYRVSETCHFYFLNTSVKHWPILIIFGKQHHEKTYSELLYFSAPHLITVFTLSCEMQKSKFGR